MQPPRIAAVVAVYAAAALAFLAVSGIASNAGAQTLGVVTIADGAATVQRGPERFAAAEGLRVQADDIVTTAAGARVLRVELDDGKTLDLGPGTQAMLLPQAFDEDDPRHATVYLGRGWAKLAAPWQLTTPGAIASARLDLRVRGTVVARVDAGQTWAYVEAGLGAASPRDGRRPAPHSLTEGEAWTQRADGGGRDGAAAPRLAALPREFTDTLPRRAARFAQAAVPPGAAQALARDDVPDWLRAERALFDDWTARHAPRRATTVAKAAR